MARVASSAYSPAPAPPPEWLLPPVIPVPPSPPSAQFWHLIEETPTGPVKVPLAVKVTVLIATLPENAGS